MMSDSVTGETLGEKSLEQGRKRSATTDLEDVDRRKRLQRMSEYMIDADDESQINPDEVLPDEVAIGFVTKDPKPRRLVVAKLSLSGTRLYFKVLNLSVKFQPFKPTEEHFKAMREHRAWSAETFNAINHKGSITIMAPGCDTFQNLRKFVFDNTEASQRYSWGWADYEDMIHCFWIRRCTDGLVGMEDWFDPELTGHGDGVRKVLGLDLSVVVQSEMAWLMLSAVRAAEKTLLDMEGMLRPTKSKKQDTTPYRSVINKIFETQASLFRELIRIRAAAPHSNK